MVKYLSDEWLERAAAALGSAPVPDDAEMVVQYEVSGGGNGKVRYVLKVEGGTATIVPGKQPDAPVTFTLDYDTAVAVVTGELSAQVAFMQGRMKLAGDVRVLIDGAAALAAVHDTLGDLRADTEY
ncbi:MAG: SCP2 sterol-binding domain-containing protein [Actinomycetes bacterium]